MTSTASSSYHLQRWQQFKGRRIGALSRLAKELGYASIRDPEFTRRIQLLTERKEVDIQQSGYVGDSMHHIKLASIDEQAFAALQGLTPATTVQPRGNVKLTVDGSKNSGCQKSVGSKIGI